MQLTSLEKSILASLVYFDIFDYSLTSFEIWKYLISTQFLENGQVLSDVSLGQVRETLKTSVNLKKIMATKSGFYFLKGRKDLVAKRKERYVFAQKYWKRLRKMVTLLQVVPYVKMIASCNKMALNLLHSKSDIDVFIVIKHGHIWFSRFLITFLVWFCRLWRHKEKIAGRICLSFYITDRHLSLKEVTLKPDDLYFAFFVANIFPLLDRERTYQKFIQVNKFIKNYLPNVFSFSPVLYERRIKKIFVLDILRQLGERFFQGSIGQFTERIFKDFQLWNMRRKGRGKTRGTDVVISDKILKFHERDKRAEYNERFRKKFKKYVKCG